VVIGGTERELRRYEFAEIEECGDEVDEVGVLLVSRRSAHHACFTACVHNSAQLSHRNSTPCPVCGQEVL